MEKIIYETIEKEMEELKSRMKKCYYNKSGLKEAEKYMKGLLSRAERKNAYGSMETKLEKFIKTAGIRWTIEMNFAETKGETGLDQYEVRSYDGWYKHITLSCPAYAFLTVLRDQFQEIPDMKAESEANMDSFKSLYS